MLQKYLSLVAGALTLLPAAALAQCTGSAGLPIVNTTFGQGTNPGSPLPAAVSGASTTYSFQAAATGKPPADVVVDGEYTLVNQVPANTLWHSGATDHTGDPDGYMAFFNAAPQAGEFYRQTVTNLCPGTTYEFGAWILNAVNSATIIGATALQPNVTFSITDLNNNTLATLGTGPIAAGTAPVWNRYAGTFTTPAGISTVVLVLSNNVAGGSPAAGNDLALDDITFRACGPQTTASFTSGTATTQYTICTTETASLFGSIGGGLNTPTYQWQVSSDGGTTWNDINGATVPNYTIGGLSEGSYLFRLLSAEAGNMGSANCRFASGEVTLTVDACNNCSDSCYWKVSGNNIINGHNIFGTVSVDDIRIQTAAADRGIITRDGLFGWNTRVPTAYLHINCAGHNENNGLSDVRFEKLEAGDGNVMVINKEGYVMDSNVPLSRLVELQNELEDTKVRYSKLEQEVTEMRKQLKAVLEGNAVGSPYNNNAILYQNTPNPFSRATVVSYSIDHINREAALVITNISGKEVARYPILKDGQGGTVVNAERWAAGVYLYTLIVDGESSDTKKMVYMK